MAESQKKVIFAECKGELYVKARYCGINQYILWIDPFTFYQWEGDPDIYVRAEDALKWFEKELEAGRREGYPPKELDRYEEFAGLYSKLIGKWRKGGLRFIND